MKLSQYEATGRMTYAGLAGVVASILRIEIAKQQLPHLQQIQHRAKESMSLRRKLAKFQVDEDVEIEQHAKDLAGVRLVFYTNSDVSRFLNAGILRSNFDIDWDRTKIHHPVGDVQEATELFVSNNYVVRLKEPRTELSEYAEFDGLWCEVQIQTTLNHAWAEMAHDTIYKKPEFPGYGGGLMEGIETRMKEIMRDYLAPAGYAFQKVLLDFDRLSEGKELFENGLDSAITGAIDCNDLHETLSKFASSVLPHLDNVELIAPDILTSVAEAVTRSRNLLVRPRETPFGSLEGKKPDDVAQIAATIIRELRFIDIKRTFEIICELYRSSSSSTEVEQWIKLARELAEPNLMVWKQAGPVVQMELMDRILGFSASVRIELKALIVPVLKHVLSTELSGTSWDYNRVTLHQGETPPTDLLRKLRQDAIAILYEYDASISDENERASLINVFFEAMGLRSFSGPPNPNLAVIVFANAAEIITYFTSKVQHWPFELRQKVEHNLLWKYGHYGKSPPSNLTNVAAEKVREQLTKAILKFRTKANEDQAFTTYKLLVGFESVFPPAWDDPEFDHTAEDAYRKAEIETLISKIDTDNTDVWLATIRRCAATQSNDLATFPMFAHFLKRLAIVRPFVALGYLRQLDERLANFLPALLSGLSETDAWPSTQELVATWIAECQFLSDLAWAFGSVEALDIGVFESIVAASIKANNDRAARCCIRSISWRDREADTNDLKPLLLQLVIFFKDRDDPTWAKAWYRRGNTSVLKELNEEDTLAVLGSLVAYPEIDHNLERLLSDLAKNWPQAVIEYFGLRLQRRLVNGREEDYEAVPYDLHDLPNVLADYPNEVVKMARVKFAENSELFEYYGGRFVKIIFPAWSSGLEIALRAYIETTVVEDKRFVVAILRAFSGEEFLQPICMDLIALLPADDPLVDAIVITLEPSGVTRGAFGRVERLKAHLATIQAWINDGRASVKVFAEKYIHQIDNSIRVEQQRSEEGLAMRQQEYGRKPNPRDPKSHD